MWRAAAHSVLDSATRSRRQAVRRSLQPLLLLLQPQPQHTRSCSSPAAPTQLHSGFPRGTCPSLAVLRAAVMAGRNVVPRPPGVEACSTDAQLADLFSFTHNISNFRGRSITERGLRVEFVPQAEAHPAARPPADSYTALTYPFTTNRVLRKQYQRFSSPFLRIGLLLEDLDSFAADVATRHLGGLPPGYTVVTAGIDKLALTTAGGHAAAGAGAAGAGAAVAAQQLGSQPSNEPQLPKGWGAGGPEQQQQQARVLDITQYPLSLHQDVRMAGQVCWAGRSSMEVLVELSTAPPHSHAPSSCSSSDQQQQQGEVQWTPRAVAHFVMVLAKSQQQQQQQQVSPGDSGPAWSVPTLVPTTPLEQQHFDAAAERAAAQKARRSDPRQLSGVEPGTAEVHLLYELAEQQLQRQIRQQQLREQGASGGSSGKQQQQGDGTPGAAGSSSSHLQPVPMSQTTQSLLAVMHGQDRNNAHQIFGGHLLRLAAELAYSTAVLHSGRHCEAVALGDVSFRRPVPIGCLLSFRAKVVHTAGCLMRVSVVATKHQQLLERPSELHESVTNDFTFVLCAVGAHPLRPVEPESLREAVQYLAAHRQHLADGYAAPPALLQPGMEHVLAGHTPTA